MLTWWSAPVDPPSRSSLRIPLTSRCSIPHSNSSSSEAETQTQLPSGQLESHARNHSSATKTPPDNSPHERAKRRRGTRKAFAAGAALSVEDTMAFVQRTRGARGRPSLGWNSLTPTELQFVDLVRGGLSNREISLRLLMSTETVKSHLSRIFRKLDVAKRVHLAALANRAGGGLTLMSRVPPGSPPDRHHCGVDARAFANGQIS